MVARKGAGFLNTASQLANQGSSVKPQHSASKQAAKANQKTTATLTAVGLDKTGGLKAAADSIYRSTGFNTRNF